MGGHGGGSARLLLTPEQEAEARRLLEAGVCQREVAAAVGVTYARLLARLDDQLADARTGQGRGGKTRRKIDPTPEEIAAECATFRRGWTRERRMKSWNPNFAGPIDAG